MAFTSGTATDYLDLLSKLRSYLVAHGWTELAHTASAGGTALQPTTQERTTLQGPGAGAGKEAYVDILSDWDSGIGSYSWRIRGMTAYVSAAAWGAHTNSSPETFFNLWANTIDYWFYVNNRRFIVVAKCGTNYMSMYAGFLLPFALPAEFPMPMYIGASFYQRELYSLNNSGNRMIADPGYYSAAYLQRASLTWRTVSNHLAVAGKNSLPACGNGFACVWPHGTTRGYNDTNANDWNQNGFLLQRPNANDELALFQAHIIDPVSRVVVGALDGVFSTSGHGRSPEQVTTYSARNFRLFGNVFRTTANDFMAIEEA